MSAARLLSLLLVALLCSAAPVPAISSQQRIQNFLEAQVNRSLELFRAYIGAVARRVEKIQNVIQRTLMPECRHPWKVVADDLCLFKPPFKRAWLDAMYFCRSIGGHLVTLRNGAEWTAVQMLDLHNGLCPWIGLRYDNRAKAFAWSSGSNATYRKWEVGEPDCGYHNEFVCEKRPTR